MPRKVAAMNWAFWLRVEKPLRSMSPRTVAIRYRSKPSKNMPMPMRPMMRRWKEEMGRRSRRAPAFTVAGRLFLTGEDGQAADGQDFSGPATILFKKIFRGDGEKFFC